MQRRGEGRRGRDGTGAGREPTLDGERGGGRRVARQRRPDLGRSETRAALGGAVAPAATGGRDEQGALRRRCEARGCGGVSGKIWGWQSFFFPWEFSCAIKKDRNGLVCL